MTREGTEILAHAGPLLDRATRRMYCTARCDWTLTACILRAIMGVMIGKCWEPTPERLNKLVLSNTAAKIGTRGLECRIERFEKNGMSPSFAVGSNDGFSPLSARRPQQRYQDSEMLEEANRRLCGGVAPPFAISISANNRRIPIPSWCAGAHDPATRLRTGASSRINSGCAYAELTADPPFQYRRSRPIQQRNNRVF